MAPLGESETERMLKRLKGFPLLNGFRGTEPVNMKTLTTLVARFSDLVMDLEDVMESIDMNPVICSGDRCVVADARIMINPHSQ